MGLRSDFADGCCSLATLRRSVLTLLRSVANPRPDPAMLSPAVYVQDLDPLNHPLLSTALAALPVVVLFCVLVPLHRPAPLAAFLGAVAAILIAWLAYGMALPQAGLAFLHGAAFGLMPVGWTIITAMLLY